MKILLVGNYENDAQNSMQRFAGFMMRRLTLAGHQVRVLRPRATVGGLYPSDRGLGKWLGYVDKFGLFPFALRSSIKWADVVHICDHANSFYTKHMRSVPHIVTCHDLLAIRSAHGEIPQNPTGWTGRQLQRLILKGLTQAQHIVCVSEATRKDLLRITRIPEHRVSRVYNSLNYPYGPMEKHHAASRLRKLRINPDRPFLLHVGGNQWYKNRLGVLRIFGKLRSFPAKQNVDLVMVGKSWTPDMRRFVTEHGLGDVTFELTGVVDEDLRALYSMARMLLFPSLQEGFGWPIIEAQSCGCLVLTSDRPPMDEVGGDAAIYVDPEELENAAVTLERALVRNSGVHEPSVENAARFTESIMIDGYLSLYDRVQKQLSRSSVESTRAAN